MFAKPFIRFIVAFNYFGMSPFCAYQNMLFPVILNKIALNYKEFGLVINILTCDRIKIAFAKGKVVNTVKDIGFAHPVAAYQTVYFGIKFK